MIRTNAENTLTIQFTNTSISDTNDISTFVSFLKTCKAETKKAGFRKIFNLEQREMINELCDELLPKEEEKK